MHIITINNTIITYRTNKSINSVPVERRVHDPEGRVIGARSLVVRPDLHRRAQDSEHLGENFFCLVHRVAR